MSALESLEKLHWVIVLVADIVILFFALLAFQRAKLRVFALVMVAALLSIIQTLAVETYDTSRLSGSEYDRFMLVWRISYIITVILSTVATVALIRHVHLRPK